MSEAAKRYSRIEAYFLPLTVAITVCNVILLGATGVMISSSAKFNFFSLEIASSNRQAIVGFSGAVIQALLGAAIFYGGYKNMTLARRIPYTSRADQIKIGSISLLEGKIVYFWKSEVDHEFNKRIDKIMIEISPVFQGNIFVLLFGAIIFQYFAAFGYDIKIREPDIYLIALQIVGVVWIFLAFRWWVRDAGACAYELGAFSAPSKQDAT